GLTPRTPSRPHKTENQPANAPTHKRAPPRRTKIAAHGDVALPLDHRRPARPEAGRGDGACHAEQLKLRPDAGAQRFADMSPWKHRPLDHANIMAELGQANRQRVAGGAGTNDADVAARGWPPSHRHKGPPVPPPPPHHTPPPP